MMGGPPSAADLAVRHGAAFGAGAWVSGWVYAAAVVALDTTSGRGDLRGLLSAIAIGLLIGALLAMALFAVGFAAQGAALGWRKDLDLRRSALAGLVYFIPIPFLPERISLGPFLAYLGGAPVLLAFFAAWLRAPWKRSS